ncbi:hypothetical protein [Rufibacter hautae]|uniref:hypothetical protein n=1 Tax=Rufibacter hautae TaxID=2595005 RepID=UPI00168040C3|nr:hypothetical protein [Rufibacter hautae]
MQVSASKWGNLVFGANNVSLSFTSANHDSNVWVAFLCSISLRTGETVKMVAMGEITAH